MSKIRDNIENWRDLPQPPSLESGTSMVVIQSSAPTGWTQNASLNDRVIRIVSGTGGGTGGSWTITGLDHTHDTVFPTTGWSATTSVIQDQPASINSGTNNRRLVARTLTSNSSSATGSSWRPSYVDAIIVIRT